MIVVMISMAMNTEDVEGVGGVGKGDEGKGTKEEGRGNG